LTTISGHITGADRVAKALDNKLPAALARNRRIFLNEAADRFITMVRHGDWFANETGKLKRELQKSKPRMTKFDGEIDVMWTGQSAVYGRVLERGPRVPRWEIKPRGLTSSGNAVKALRWVGGARNVGGSFATGAGVVHYARKVIHVDRPSSRRPHIAPVMHKIDPWLEKKQAEMIRNAKHAAGLP
jgi:hypothetical protein